jgi:hypothetical protein
MIIFLRKYFSSLYEYRDSFIHYGLKGLMIELGVRRSIWTLGSTRAFGGNKKVATSITDRPDYLTICQLAATDSNVQNSYKRCREYRLVLEHVSRYQGEQYLQCISDRSSILTNMINISQYEIGNPIKYHYENVGFISPTQIRYAKILDDLHKLFGTLQEKTIVEVGVGNGGQAVQICNFERVRKYFLVDLPEVLALTATAVVPYGILDRLEFIPPNELTDIQSDLFISNYAFSELKKVVQDFYLEHLVHNSKSGYMLYNHIHSHPNDSYTVHEIASMIPGSQIFAEEPKTFADNYLIVWGHNKN